MARCNPELLCVRNWKTKKIEPLYVHVRTCLGQPDEEAHKWWDVAKNKGKRGGNANSCVRRWSWSWKNQYLNAWKSKAIVVHLSQLVRQLLHIYRVIAQHSTNTHTLINTIHTLPYTHCMQLPYWIGASRPCEEALPAITKFRYKFMKNLKKTP